MDDVTDVVDDLAKLANRKPMTDAVRSFLRSREAGDDVPGDYGTVAYALLDAAVRAEENEWDTFVYVDDDNGDWVAEESGPYTFYEGTYYVVTAKGDVFAVLKTRA
jgi:hypothetical protein